MKALSAVLACLALSAAAHAGAARPEQQQAQGTADAPTTTLVADAGRSGTAGWQGGRWAGATTLSPAEIDATGASSGHGLLESVGAANLALITLGALALVLPRPLARALHRREQRRRATALASALGQASGR